ncbi:TetR/AcrR family transcriptional regulator [bacterium]|nr:TetR/AcrR family transcriptional regulator [bacterium]
MPKVRCSKEDRDIIRKKILDEVLTVISEQGFSSFNMRRLASRLNLSVRTISHYYSSKNELYLMILTKGFSYLHELFSEIFETRENPAFKLSKMIEAYIDFGINRAHYYNIMFTSDAPKYRDYIGTGIEPVAFLEKQTALKLFDITSRALQEAAHDTKCISDAEIHLFVFKIWSTLQGILSLYSIRILPEVDEDTEQIISYITRDLQEPIVFHTAINA